MPLQDGVAGENVAGEFPEPGTAYLDELSWVAAAGLPPIF